jgi:hypothetical protein
MNILRNRLILCASVVIFIAGVLGPSIAMAVAKGIYITSGTARSTKTMKYLIKRSKATGINTFVIDVYGRNKKYSKNIAMVKQAGIRYVARVVVFPYGARHHQVKSRKIWEKRWKWAKYAVSLGADAIQLDYIRYHRKTQSSINNEKNIDRVIRFFRHRLKDTGVKLQIDIFGVAAHRPTRTIGQNVQLFAPSLDAINPMVYPSHYEPYRHHAVRPYETVFDSVSALKKQLHQYPNVKINAFIEISNYRYKMGYAAKQKYLKAQMKAAMKAGANGWYVWSANNHYKILFNLLDKKKRHISQRK